MNAAAPEGAPPRRINDRNILKLPCPAVPRRGPEAGDPRNIMNFHSSGVKSRSYAFLQNRKLGRRIFNTELPKKLTPAEPFHERPLREAAFTGFEDINSHRYPQ